MLEADDRVVPPRVRRRTRQVQRVSLTGEEAVRWLRERGYVTLRSSAEFHLTADELHYDDFILRRVSFTSIDVLRRPVDEIGRVTSSVFLRGASAGGLDGVVSEIAPGTVVFHDDADIVSFTNSTPVLVLQIETTWARIQIPNPQGDLAGRALMGDSGSLDMLVAFANTVLDTDLDPEAEGIIGLRLAVESCLSAVAATSIATVGTRSDAIASWNLYRRAAGLILENSGDPAFDIDVLSEELDVSRRRLSRAFTVANTSPTKYLRRIRALNAFELMAGGTPLTEGTR
ncbi:helix-turn-helix transcriptional regulator [Microbacteriaceae bacterium VKM Ac-2854]|nr:helix-turn-helix transcriptional regulator [Microbacteriaceae bacterium VKM Ac-2854]